MSILSIDVRPCYYITEHTIHTTQSIKDAKLQLDQNTDSEINTIILLLNIIC